MLSNHKKFEVLKYLTERLKNEAGQYEIRDSIALQEIASDWGYSWNAAKSQFEKAREKRGGVLKVTKGKVEEPEDILFQPK